MKGYSTFLKAPELEPHYQIILYHIQDTIGESYISADIQSVYSKQKGIHTIFNNEFTKLLRQAYSQPQCTTKQIFKSLSYSSIS